jgi:DNA-binding NarL/FixJ family response regulator/plasmid stability protein
MQIVGTALALGRPVAGADIEAIRDLVGRRAERRAEVEHVAVTSLPDGVGLAFFVADHVRNPESMVRDLLRAALDRADAPEPDALAPPGQQSARLRIGVDGPRSVERIAIESIIAADPRFLLVSRPGPDGRAGADVVVRAGPPARTDEPRGLRPAAVAAMRPRTLFVLPEHAATEAVRALRAGAAGLTCLRCHCDDLPRALAAIAAGMGWITPCLAAVVADHFCGRARIPASDSRGLTPTEYQVLRAIAAGADNSEVAAGLGIDVRTARYHASNIYRKLGARHRAEAVALAYRLGLTA